MPKFKSPPISAGFFYRTDMSNFYTGALKEVSNMARLKREGLANRREALSKTKDVSEAKVGIRGI